MADQVIYATEAELIAREGSNTVSQASDLDNTGAIDHGRVAQALSDASVLMDGYLGSRYALPLTIVPPALSLHCCRLAICMMSIRPTDAMKDRYDATIKWLEKIASGTFQLGIDETGNAPPSENSAVSFTETRKVFTQHELADYTDFRGRRR